MLCIALFVSCSGGDHTKYILTAGVAGGGMTAAIPAEGGYIDIDMVSNLPWIIMETSPNGTTWLRWPMEYISLETISVSGDKSTVRITLDPNLDTNNRVIYIRFANANRTLVSGTITLTQDALPEG